MSLKMKKMKKQQLVEHIQMQASFFDKHTADHANLLEEGLDSIHVMQLSNQWRAQGHSVTYIELVEKPTLVHWASLLGCD